MAVNNQEIEITILNWEKFNPRRDVKQSSWFRMEHGLFEKPEFYQFDHSEICLWVYILCLASRKNGPTVTLYVLHANRVGRFDDKTIESGLEKLNDIEVITYKHVTRPVRTRTPTVRRRALRDETRRDDTVRDVTDTPSAGVVSNEFPDLVLLWNEQADSKLCRVEEIGKDTRRYKKVQKAWKEKPDLDYWLSVIQKINKTPFCLGGGDRGWRADLEWITSKDNRIHLLEGKYDARGNGLHPITKSQKIQAQNDDLFARQMEKATQGSSGDGSLGN